ncbi:MAG: histidine kinase [Syntrophomonadaceae bacterium]|nr:histidine kinase [Syntrophomonadaceae bacterium]
MTMINYINASLEIWGCVMSGVVALCLLVSKRVHDARNRLYLQMLAFNTGALFFDMLALFFRGHQGDFFWLGVRAANFIAFSCNYLLMLTFVHYLTEYLGQRTAVSLVALRISRIICALSLGLVVLTQFFPIFYTIDAQNVYHRADLFWLSHAMGMVCLFLCAGLLCRHRAVLEPQEKAGLWAYIILPLGALLVQIFIYGLILLGLVNTISLVVIFLFLQAEQGRRLAEQENQLTQSAISIMLSQIQPHFLYNTLGAIHYLCKSDPDQAQAAVDDFATYLRGNMDSLKRTTPIPFDQELDHVRIYLSLEKMRCDEKLNIDYDLQATGFLLPALTVQPLVENAVKYGVGNKKGGGTVTLSSREYPDCYTVTISDDGAGYDPYATQADGRTHIGVSNVRDRLAAMCHGSLSIESSPGAGTTATIMIPKGDGK